MATNIDYGSDYENPSATIFRGMNDYGKEAGDYGGEATTMNEVTDYKFCPLLVSAWLSMPLRPESMETMQEGVKCHGPRCAWYDASKERCAVLTIARGR